MKLLIVRGDIITGLFVCRWVCVCNTWVLRHCTKAIFFAWFSWFCYRERKNSFYFSILGGQSSKVVTVLLRKSLCTFYRLRFMFDLFDTLHIALLRKEEPYWFRIKRSRSQQLGLYRKAYRHSLQGNIPRLAELLFVIINLDRRVTCSRVWFHLSSVTQKISKMYFCCSCADWKCRLFIQHFICTQYRYCQIE